MTKSIAEKVQLDPNDSRAIKEATEETFDLLLYSAKSITLTPCGGAISLRGDSKKARRVVWYWSLLVFIVYSLEMVLTAVDMILSEKSRESKGQDQKIQSEMENWWLDVLQILLTVTTMYMIAVF